MYLAEKLVEGYDLETAMKESLEDLDGVFTYMVVTKDALGVAKDEMAAKPLVLYESDNLVAMASEEVAHPRAHRPRDRHVRPLRERGPGVDTVARGERRITYDARGLAEPDAEVPKVSDIVGEKATFNAAGLTTRQINLELRWLLYERGIRDVTVQNPGAKHSLGVGILTRCRLTFEGASATSAWA